MDVKCKKLIIIISISLVVVVSILIPVIIITAYYSLNTYELGQSDTGGEAHDVEIEGDIAYVVDTAEGNPGGAGNH